MTVRLPPGVTLDGDDLLADSEWDNGPDTVNDVLRQLGTDDPAAVRELMNTPQWNDFSPQVRQDVAAWLADH